jgi:YHS domain-containing protein
MSCRRSVIAAPSRSSATSVDDALAFDAMGSPREHSETVGSDLPPTPKARPIGPGVEPPQRRIDQLEQLDRSIAKGKVALLGEDLARGSGLRPVRHLARRRDGLAELVHQASPFGFESRTRCADVWAVHRRTLRAWPAPTHPRIYSQGVRQVEDGAVAIEIDPVCGMEVDTTTSTLSFEYESTTYWFCGKGCLLDFQDDPDKYLDEGYKPSM